MLLPHLYLLILSGRTSINNQHCDSASTDECRYMIDNVSYAFLWSYSDHMSLDGTVYYTNIFMNVLPPPAIWKS
jgi:hypothetical protein